MFARGRSNEQALIEDSSEIFSKILTETPKYWKCKEKFLNKEFKEIAKIESDGECEIETSIYSSLSSYLDDFVLIEACFMEAFILSIYSFYERCLKKIAQQNGIIIPRKTKKNISYALHIINQIKKHHTNLNNDEKINQLINEIDGEKYRSIRNNIAHEEFQGFEKFNSEYAEEFLMKITTILLYISSTLEMIKKNIDRE